MIDRAVTRLAAAGFADQAERLAAADVERHVVDGRRLAAVREAEHRAEVLDAEAAGRSDVDFTVLAEHAPERVGNFAQRRAGLDGGDDGRHEIRAIRAAALHSVQCAPARPPRRAL